ncbi:hypothetical protein LMG1861_05088 [Achromobacter piechaudii]|uniref:Uncharacterized protein n=1 Tax=Achromobacter piechaudii TaxID=72556 RepID=A0A6S7ELF4_9BURK|nr:hypothetical protein LMG1861_05088 [Achromobacter piechaudii]
MCRFSAAGRFFYSKGESSRVWFVQLVSFALANAFFKLSDPVFQVMHASQSRTLAVGCCRSLLVHGNAVRSSQGELCLQLISRSRYLSLILQFDRRLVGACSER